MLSIEDHGFQACSSKGAAFITCLGNALVNSTYLLSFDTFNALVYHEEPISGVMEDSIILLDLEILELPLSKIFEYLHSHFLPSP